MKCKNWKALFAEIFLIEVINGILHLIRNCYAIELKLADGIFIMMDLYIVETKSFQPKNGDLSNLAVNKSGPMY